MLGKALKAISKCCPRDSMVSLRHCSNPTQKEGRWLWNHSTLFKNSSGRINGPRKSLLENPASLNTAFPNSFSFSWGRVTQVIWVLETFQLWCSLLTYLANESWVIVTRRLTQKWECVSAGTFFFYSRGTYSVPRQWDAEHCHLTQGNFQALSKLHSEAELTILLVCLNLNTPLKSHWRAELPAIEVYHRECIYKT